MKEWKYITTEEQQQMLFAWRYIGFVNLELLTEEEVDEVNEEMDALRRARTGTTAPDGKVWGEWDPFSYPHKLSPKLAKLYSHPKILEAAEFLMGSEIIGMQSWGYFKPPGQLGRDMHQNAFYTKCGPNEIITSNRS